MNIVLVGMSGSGKSTVAYALSKLSGFERIDCDELIERKFGKISKIFEEQGEEFFRNLESDIVEQCSHLQAAIISTGGGCLLRQKNVDLLKSNGTIVYLRTSANELEKRLKGDQSRPLLKGDIKVNLKEMLAARKPIYSANADITIDTDGLTPEQVAKVIWEKVK